MRSRSYFLSALAAAGLLCVSSGAARAAATASEPLPGAVPTFPPCALKGASAFEAPKVKLAYLTVGSALKRARMVPPPPGSKWLIVHGMMQCQGTINGRSIFPLEWSELSDSSGKIFPALGFEAKCPTDQKAQSFVAIKNSAALMGISDERVDWETMRDPDGSTIISYDPSRPPIALCLLFPVEEGAEGLTLHVHGTEGVPLTLGE